MLDRLPSRILKLIIQYTRTWDYTQHDLLQLSQVSRTLRALSIKKVWEFFSLLDVVETERYAQFAHIQPHLSRLLITDSDSISDAQWETALRNLNQLTWTHITMVSVGLGELRRRSAHVSFAIVAFARALTGVRELWVELGPADVTRALFDAQFSSVRELRVIGGERSIPGGAVATAGAFAQLTAVHVDADAARRTDMCAVVRAARASLVELHVSAYSAVLGGELGLCGAKYCAPFPSMLRVALVCAPGAAGVLVDGARLPRVAVLAVCDCVYPAQGGYNRVSRSDAVRLAAGEWLCLRTLVVDGLSRGDVARLALSMGRLEVLSVGALDASADVGAEPAVALSLAATSQVLQRGRALTELRVELPDEFDDAFSNYGAVNGHPQARRPADPGFVFEFEPQTNLRHLTLNSWALTLGQISALVGRLPALNYMEGSVAFSGRHAENTLRREHRHLSHLSLACDTVSRHRHVFKASMVRFVQQLVALRTLDLYGDLDAPGLEKAIVHFLPQCSVGFYPLVPSWVLDAIDEEAADTIR